MFIAALAYIKVLRLYIQMGFRLDSSKRDGSSARSKRRELRCRLPDEKWKWLDEWLRRGVGQTYAQLVILSLEAFEEKLRNRRLTEARLQQIVCSTEDTR